MNISIYLPDKLMDRLELYLKRSDLTKNAAVRKAIELLLDREEKKEWGAWIHELDGDPNFPDINELRSDLGEPRDINL